MLLLTPSACCLALMRRVTSGCSARAPVASVSEASEATTDLMGNYPPGYVIHLPRFC